MLDGLEQWQQDLLPQIIFWTAIGVAVLTGWAIGSRIIRTIDKKRSGAD
jgi:hypothetical protein